MVERQRHLRIRYYECVNDASSTDYKQSQNVLAADAEEDGYVSLRFWLGRRHPIRERDMAENNLKYKAAQIVKVQKAIDDTKYKRQDNFKAMIKAEKSDSAPGDPRIGTGIGFSIERATLEAQRPKMANCLVPSRAPLKRH